ncbi:MAG: cell division protein SepF [Acidimicrobiales bacterium]
MTGSGPHTVDISTFNDVAEVGDVYRSGRVVEMSVRDAEPEVARRAVDFATGLVYGDRGSMSRIDQSTYRLVPNSQS